MDLGLKDKVAIITGGAGGIGLGIGQGLLAEGAKVALADIDEAKAAAAAQKLAEKFGKGRAIGLKTDVSRKESVQEMLTRTVSLFGTVHILVNNVGLTIPGWMEAISDQDIQRTFDINMKGYIYCTQAVLPHMKKQNFGRIIYMSSASGLKASGGLALYSGSKYFDRGLAIAVGLEAGKYNITANAICPSDVYPESEFDAGSWHNEKLIRVSLEKEGVSSFEELKKKRSSANPMKRSCTVDDVANLVVFLASERAGFLNAQSFSVTGGAVPI